MSRLAQQKARTRKEILDAAVRVASLEGLIGLTIGRLADEVGMSKAGLFAHFGSKDALQLATVQAAQQQFVDEVMGAGVKEKAGVPRLKALLEAYFKYIERRANKGGCFVTAATLEFDDRPGPVRDELVALGQARSMLICAALSEAATLLKAKWDVPQLAFEVTALAVGANVEFQLTRDPLVLQRARRALASKLAALKAKLPAVPV
jgi:AcrR family transcriptional regulator